MAEKLLYNTLSSKLINNYFNIMRTIFSTFLVLFFSLNLFSQEKEAGLFVGATAFQGDLIEGSFDFNELNIGVGAFYRFYTSPKFSFRLGVNAGIFTGDDANHTGQRQERGMSFESSIIDASAIAEWNILGINIYGEGDYNQNRLSPYLLLGIGGAFYDVSVTTSRVDLAPLDANNEYPAFSLVIPMGLGVKYATPRVTLGIEGSIRAGLSDYLDGVSKSGEPDNNDWYGFYGINAAYRIGEIYTSSKPKAVDEFEATEEEDDYEYDEYDDDGGKE